MSDEKQLFLILSNIVRPPSQPSFSASVASTDVAANDLRVFRARHLSHLPLPGKGLDAKLLSGLFCSFFPPIRRLRTKCGAVVSFVGPVVSVVVPVEAAVAAAAFVVVVVAAVVEILPPKLAPWASGSLASLDFVVVDSEHFPPRSFGSAPFDWEHPLYLRFALLVVDLDSWAFVPLDFAAAAFVAHFVGFVATIAFVVAAYCFLVVVVVMRMPVDSSFDLASEVAPEILDP